MRTGSGQTVDSGDALLRRMVARRRRDNAVIVVLAVLAVLGGGHAILSMFSTGTTASPDDAGALALGRAQLAGSFAEQFVVTYLTSSAGQQDQVGQYVSLGQQRALPPTGRQVTNPEIVYLSRSVSTGTLDVWSVTVSVQVSRANAPAAVRQYYRVAVSVGGGRLRALSLPALVQPPGRGNDLSLAYSTPCGADSPLGQVASGFLAALLTGAGDITRYTTAGAGIVALQPSPLTEIGAISVSSDDTGCGTANNSARILATITPKADGTAFAALSYPLTMVRTDGQWQVQSLDSVPLLKTPLAEVVGGDSNIGAASTASSTLPTSAPAPTVPIPSATQK
ncbi:conjugal transfer protein [Nocardia sp. CDC160]|uniref:conjugal transfer protein n=1 Tax=Nocardia sp. CDC160 TaxID=3112166 RepID=UPI002DBC8C72|nr:conjugal transfer protein [Nocardia sp. CDC160]MEC3920669.1 conjugal transfer protein [Nocardia sp. CDC160]